MNKIAIYAICKNESKFIDKWLESMSEADIIVVLDTGSTDDTYNKLLKYKEQYNLIVAQKKYETFRFDVARNDSLDLVPDEYNILVCTDLDELLDKGWSKRLREEWIEGVHERGEYMYAWSHKEDLSPARVFAYNKIHSKKWKWIFPVHECLVRDYINNTNYNENYTNEETLRLGFDMFLHHYPDNQKSRGSYLSLLEQRAKEYPNDLYGLVYLAHERSYRGLYEKSNELLNDIILKTQNDTLMTASCYLFMGDNYKALNDIDNSLKSYKKAIETDKTYLEPYLCIAELLLESCPELSIKYVKDGLANSYRHYSWLERDSSWTFQPYDILCLAYWNIGDKKSSLACSIKASEQDKSNERLKNNILYILNNIDKSEY